MIGSRVPMLDARARVTGRLRYVQDLSLPGMLHARILRSPYAHARIRSVDASRAERLPGVIAALTRNDLEDPRLDPWFGPFLKDQAVVAMDKARYVGDPVAAVAAVDEATAEEALELIEVVYEELPAVFDLDEALADGAPILHEGERRIGNRRRDIVYRQPSLANSNIVHLFRQRKGDVDAAFAEADVIVEGTYESPQVQHVPLETHAIVAEFETDGRASVWASSQAPSGLARMLAGILRRPDADVRVRVPTLGGGYGAKIDPSVEPICLLLALKANRPVRLALSRSEEFLTAAKHAARVRVRTAVRRNGTLLGHQATCLYDSGAYARDTPEKIYRGYASMGPYRVPNVRVDSYGVYTNRVPTCAFRGFGIPQVSWAHESQMDRVAAELGMDPLELRLRNVLHEGDAFSTGELMPEDTHYPELLQTVARKIDWSWPAADSRRSTAGGAGPARSGSPRHGSTRHGSTRRGKGIAAIVKGMSAFPAAAVARINVDGSLNILTNSVEMGQGATTALTQIAADEARLPLERVRVAAPDTESAPFDMMTAASRTTSMMGRAIRGAVADARSQLLALAADQLEISVDDLELIDGEVVTRDGAQRKAVSAVLAAARTWDVYGRGRYDSPISLDLETGQGIGAPQWHPAACAAEVEVDIETGRVRLLRLHVALYVGRMINPLMCELQVEGAALFGIGQALFEEMAADESGQLQNANLGDYLIPSFRDVPDGFGESILETPGTLVVHGIGETALPSIAPAIGNAVAQALGVRVMSLPITPEKVLRALQDPTTEAAGEPMSVRAAPVGTSA